MDAKTELEEGSLPAESLHGEDRIELETGEAIVLKFVRIEQMQLFHGSPIPNIEELKEAHETTLGLGVYLTSSQDSASDYAIIRSGQVNSPNPVVYEVEVGKLKLLDLTTEKSLKPFSKLLRQELVKRRKIYDGDDSDSRWTRKSIDKNLDNIDKNNFRALRDLTWNFQDWTTEMLSGLGYDGLISFEGGEVGHGVEKAHTHDTYLVFDPTKVKVINGLQIASSLSAES